MGSSSLGTVLVDIAANTSQLKTDLEGARRDLSSFKGGVEGMMGKVQGLGRSILALGGLSLTIGGLGKAAIDAAISFAQSERQSLRLEAVLKATGNTAGVTAKELRSMASALSRTSLFDDKTILAATSQLLTFENISGKTLKRAIKLSVDLAEVWDGDVSSAALALGKALQSPADAASLLGKAKVRLTEEEKQLIEQFIRLNQLAGAQGVILDVLQGKVGGTAEGASQGLAGAFHRLAIKIDDARKALVAFVTVPAPASERFTLDELGARYGRRKTLAHLLGEGRPTGGHGLGDDGEPAGFDAATIRENLSKEVGGLTALAGIDPSRLGSAEISRLRELATILPASVRDAAMAYREGKGPLEDWVRALRELKAVQEALAKLPLGSRPNRGFLTDKDGQPITRSVNLGAMRDLSRMGASPQEQAAIQAAIANSRLSSAMTGVGGERGLSPFGEEKAKAAAELWRATWVNAIEGTQQAFADFFMSIGQEGFKLVDLFKGIAKAVQNVLAQMASQVIVNTIFGGLNLRGPGGASVGNSTQSGGGQGYVPRMAPTTAIHQNIAFNVSAMDGASVQAMLRTHSATIAGVVAEAASDAPGFAAHIVAHGMRR